ncbi:ApbE family lipoprotein [Caldithrix abyssi DSM 13497]|uniref:FAD:protein FMN transferase n=2 Tax=Caldithrix abyssi DSM 13497 TaxID=880073 RepID=H1XNF8_CALAY|nr:ApbE family lipoprotein [Caldithrix abyssi DSM 13497]
MKLRIRNFLSVNIIVFLLLISACRQNSLIQLEGRTMGTVYHIKLIDDVNASISEKELQSAVDSLLNDINRQMSTYQPQSEISRFNRWRSTEPFKVSPEFLRVVQKALKIYRETNGAFDITVGPLVDLWGFGRKGARFEPPDSQQIARILQRVGAHQLKVCGDTALCKLNPDLEIDLGAIAKGYGVDAVSRLLKENGFTNFMVEIGGEVYASGKKGDRPWRIGVDQPQYNAPPGQMVEAVLNLENCAVATSGDYRNFFEYRGKIYSHELDPHTGWPVANGLASVTVIAPDCMTADALATAIMVMGDERGLPLINSKKGTEALILKREGEKGLKALWSKGMKNYLLQGN